MPANLRDILLDSNPRIAYSEAAVTALIRQFSLWVCFSETFGPGLCRWNLLRHWKRCSGDCFAIVLVHVFINMSRERFLGLVTTPTAQSGFNLMDLEDER